MYSLAMLWGLKLVRIPIGTLKRGLAFFMGNVEGFYQEG